MKAIDKSIMDQFDEIRAQNFPIGEYAITASGPLGVRGIRPIDDVDIIVTQKLWEKLNNAYGATDDQGVKKIRIPDTSIEVLGEGSYYFQSAGGHGKTVEERIQRAEVIADLPFEPLDAIAYFKRKMGRDKDLRDVELIASWLKSNPR